MMRSAHRAAAKRPISCPRVRRPGMTLVELLVALTLLVTMTSLLAGLWGQMRAWSDENAAITGSIGPQRVGEFLRRQWADRRSILPLDEKRRAAVLIGPDRLEFVTARPALFPECPLVRAAWVVERRPDARPPDQWPARLVYEETRVTRLDLAIDQSFDSQGAEAKRRWTLLEDCRGLRLDVLTESPASTSSAAAAPDPLARGWRPADGESFVRADLPADKAEARAGKPESAGRGAARPPRSRTDSVRATGTPEEESAPLRAVRIAGKAGGEEFEWALIVDPSR